MTYPTEHLNRDDRRAVAATDRIADSDVSEMLRYMLDNPSEFR